MLKIAFVDITNGFGGAIISLSHLVNHLDKSRYRPLLIFEMNTSIIDELFHADIDRIQIKHKINYADWQRISKNVMALNIGAFRKPLLYILSILKDTATLQYLVKVAFICRKRRIDILHVNNGAAIMEGFLLSRLLRVPLILHQRGETGVSYVTRFFYRHTEHFIAISQFIKDRIIANGGSAEKIYVIHNPNKSSIKQNDGLRMRLGINDECVCIGVFGRIISWKGQEIFMRAAIELLKKHAKLNVFLIGDTSYKDRSYYMKVRWLAEQSAHLNRIHFTGYVSNVDDYYSLMDIVAHTSISPEPFGRVIIEAMMHGKPVVASDEGGPREIITHGSDGILIQPGNPVLLEKALDALIMDSQQRRIIGEKARKKACADFTAESHAQRVSMIYDDLAQNLG